MPPARGVHLFYAWRPMDCIHITDLEAAINHWRARCTAAPDFALPSPMRELADAYAAADPAQPTMPAFLTVANGLCAALGRRPFTPEPRKGYWMVS